MHYGREFDGEAEKRWRDSGETVTQWEQKDRWIGLQMDRFPDGETFGVRELVLGHPCCWYQSYHSEPNSIRYALKRHLFRVVLA